MSSGIRRGRGRGGFRAILRAPAGRITNQTLLVALVLVFGTGVATVPIGSSSGRWVAIAHGIAGLMILLLVPWKSRVVRGGLRRGRATRWVSLLLASLVVITFAAGVGTRPGWCARSRASLACGCISRSRWSWCPWSCGISWPGGSGRGGRICRGGPSCGPGCWGRGRPGFELAAGPDPGRRPGPVAADRGGRARPGEAVAGVLEDGCQPAVG